MSLTSPKWISPTLNRAKSRWFCLRYGLHNAPLLTTKLKMAFFCGANLTFF
jgi:hypothetical protein